MAHYKFTGGGRVKNADNWTFQTNPYITARPQIHCVGDDCKRSDLNVYYQYGQMDMNPPVFIQYIPVMLVVLVIIVICAMFLYRRWKANKAYEGSMASRMEEDQFIERVQGF